MYRTNHVTVISTGQVEDAIACNLGNQVPEIKRRILAKQSRGNASTLIGKCAVFVGTHSVGNEKVGELSAVLLDVGEKFSTYTLTAPPELCGSQFASCVWRNELYVSRGTEEGTCLSRYITGNNEWEMLPQCEQGLQNHAMAAVDGNIYMLGGMHLRTKVAITCESLKKDIIIVCYP